MTLYRPVVSFQTFLHKVLLCSPVEEVSMALAYDSLISQISLDSSQVLAPSVSAHEISGIFFSLQSKGIICLG